MKVKNYTEEVLKWSETEEQVLRQRAKINRLRLGDGNNAYFHAYMKAKQERMT